MNPHTSFAVMLSSCASAQLDTSQRCPKPESEGQEGLFIGGCRGWEVGAVGYCKVKAYLALE